MTSTICRKSLGQAISLGFPKEMAAIKSLGAKSGTAFEATRANKLKQAVQTASGPAMLHIEKLAGYWSIDSSVKQGKGQLSTMSTCLRALMEVGGEIVHGSRSKHVACFDRASAPTLMR